jgi:hypothetical protein
LLFCFADMAEQSLPTIADLLGDSDSWTEVLIQGGQVQEHDAAVYGVEQVPLWRF